VNSNNFLINCNPKSDFIRFSSRNSENARPFASVYCWPCHVVSWFF